MRLSDSSWHEECLFCSQCHCPLVNSCYYRDGKLFCRVDYERSVGTGSCKASIARIYEIFWQEVQTKCIPEKTNIRIFNFLESLDINRTPISSPLSKLASSQLTLPAPALNCCLSIWISNDPKLNQFRNKPTQHDTPIHFQTESWDSRNTWLRMNYRT